MGKYFTKAFLSMLQDSLETDEFRAGDFTIMSESDKNSTDLGTSAVIAIRPSFDQNAFFRIDSSSSSPGQLTIYYTPAGLSVFFEGTVNPDVVSGAIDDWLRDLWDELVANDPVGRMVHEYSDFVNELKEKISSLDAEPFSDEERESILKWLEDLEQRVSELEEATEENSDAINRFENDIDTLKTTIDRLDKPSWLFMLATRFDSWLSDPGTPLKLVGGIEAVKQLTENTGL